MWLELHFLLERQSNQRKLLGCSQFQREGAAAYKCSAKRKYFAVGEMCLPARGNDGCTLIHAAKERCCWFLPALWGVISMPVASPLLWTTVSCPVFVLQASSWSTCGPGAQEKLWWPRRWMRWGCCKGKDEAGALSCSVCKTWQVCVCVHGENSFLSGPLSDLLAGPQEKARNT